MHAQVLPFHRAVMAHADFVNGQRLGVHTRWIETQLMPHWAEQPQARPLAQGTSGLQRMAVEIDGRRIMLGLPTALLAGMATAPGSVSVAGDDTVDEHAVPAPSAGTLTAWKVVDGATVQAGELIAVMEAMKMEMQLNAPRTGRITCLAEAGSYQTAGAVIARIA